MNEWLPVKILGAGVILFLLGVLSTFGTIRAYGSGGNAHAWAVTAIALLYLGLAVMFLGDKLDQRPH